LRQRDRAQIGVVNFVEIFDGNDDQEDCGSLAIDNSAVASGSYPSQLLFRVSMSAEDPMSAEMR